MDIHWRMALLFFILMIILATTLEQMLYASGEVVLSEKAELTLLEAVEDGLNSQYAALGLYEAGIKMKPAKKYEHCAIISTEGKHVKDIVVDGNKIIVTSDIDTKIRHTVLAKKGINADSLFTRWSKILYETKIISHHALQIHIRTNMNSTFVCGDSTLLKPKYKRLNSIYAGLNNEIEIVPFIRYSWFTIIRNASMGIIVLGEFAVLIFLFFAFLYYLRKRTNEKVYSIEEKPVTEINLANLRYIYNSHEFYVNERKLQIRAQSSSLLLLFLKSPSYCITKEEIISSLWRLGDDGVQDRVRRAISDLRKLFRDESVQITVELTENGYRLVV